MEKLRIQAATPETGREMLAALSEFKAELLESSDGCEVVISFGGDDHKIIGVLDVLERYVTERANGPARMELNGKSYVLNPVEGASASVGDGLVPDPREQFERQVRQGLNHVRDRLLATQE